MYGYTHCQNCETKDRQQFKELLLSIGIKDFKFTKYQFDQIDLLFLIYKITLDNFSITIYHMKIE